MRLMKRLKHSFKIRLSNLRVARSERKVRHVRTADAEMLVFANEDVGRLIWLNGVFEEAETAFFKREVRHNDICFDIGGNVGYFSVLMAGRATGGHVHVFEPIPLNAAMIRTNLELNALTNATVNQLALSDESGTVTFSVSTDSAYSSMRPTGTFGEARAIDVTMRTLDDHVAANGIARVDVVKVDVEGAEEKVLLGGEKLFRDPARRPRLMMLELYDANLAPYGATVERIVAMMRDWGYRPHTLTEDGAQLVPLDSALINVVYNIFFTPDA